VQGLPVDDDLSDLADADTLADIAASEKLAEAEAGGWYLLAGGGLKGALLRGFEGTSGVSCGQLWAVQGGGGIGAATAVVAPGGCSVCRGGAATDVHPQSCTGPSVPRVCGHGNSHWVKRPLPDRYPAPIHPPICLHCRGCCTGGGGG
jgi:hypothetical protein